MLTGFGWIRLRLGRVSAKYVTKGSGGGEERGGTKSSPLFVFIGLFDWC